MNLHDIRGLDAIPWWPLAHGWWWVIGIAAALLLIIVFARYVESRRDPMGPGRRDARRKLRSLRRRVSKTESKNIAEELSELLRRIAMLRSSRQDCAGLSGDPWLEWLADNDPNGFDWQKRGQLLLNAPYAPLGQEVKHQEFLHLINAALHWVDACKPGKKLGKGVSSNSAQKSELTRA